VRANSIGVLKGRVKNIKIGKKIEKVVREGAEAEIIA